MHASIYAAKARRDRHMSSLRLPVILGLKYYCLAGYINLAIDWVEKQYRVCLCKRGQLCRYSYARPCMEIYYVHIAHQVSSKLSVMPTGQISSIPSPIFYRC